MRTILTVHRVDAEALPSATSTGPGRILTADRRPAPNRAPSRSQMHTILTIHGVDAETVTCVTSTGQDHVLAADRVPALGRRPSRSPPRIILTVHRVDTEAVASAFGTRPTRRPIASHQPPQSCGVSKGDDGALLPNFDDPRLEIERVAHGL